MRAISVRLDERLYDQVRDHCRDTGQTRISLLKEAVENLCIDAGIDLTKVQLYLDDEEPLSEEPPWHKWSGALNRYKTIEKESKGLASKVSEETYAQIELLAFYECFGGKHRKVLEFGLRRYLESKGILTTQIDPAAIEAYCFRKNPSIRLEHLFGMVHDDRNQFTRLPDDFSFPASLRSSKVILIDSALLLLCLAQDEEKKRASRIFEACLRGKAQPVISTASLTDVVLGAQAVLQSDDSKPAFRIFQANDLGMIFSHTRSDLERRMSALVKSGVLIVPVIASDYTRALSFRAVTDAPWSRLLSLAAVSRHAETSEIAVLRIVRSDTIERFNYGYEIVSLPADNS